MSTIISVEKLSKAYQLGKIGSGTLANDLRVWWAKARGKPNPLLKIGQQDHSNRDGETVWALRDVSFTLDRGEVLGIIGRNGAGKSTLLKILSRVTAPTLGKVMLKGRVASLLEVGTGFHVELTGRENIFLNGAIMGMNRAEVSRKLDEIIEFSGVEKYIDTPVKRYSSGMFVRLAFAVAAHLEPDVLIVDEVLAVGDAEFQKKSLGKMDDVSKQGRAVIFVSHNMGIIRSLCFQTILLTNGQISQYGPTNDVINYYLASASETESGGEITWDPVDAPGGEELKLIGIRLLSEDGKILSVFDQEHPITVEIIYRLLKPLRSYRFVLQLVNQEGVTVFASTDHMQRGSATVPAGCYEVRCEIPSRLLKQGSYRVMVSCGIPKVKHLVQGEEYLSFTVEGKGSHGSFFPENWPGVIAPDLKWTKDKELNP